MNVQRHVRRSMRRRYTRTRRQSGMARRDVRSIGQALRIIGFILMVLFACWFEAHGASTGRFTSLTNKVAKYPHVHVDYLPNHGKFVSKAEQNYVLRQFAYKTHKTHKVTKHVRTQCNDLALLATGKACNH